jgi:hypothetical protein
VARVLDLVGLTYFHKVHRTPLAIWTLETDETNGGPSGMQPVGTVPEYVNSMSVSKKLQRTRQQRTLAKIVD